MKVVKVHSPGPYGGNLCGTAPDIADGGELEWMVRHAQTMLVSYAERCSQEGKHALRQKIRDGIRACSGEGQ